MGGNSLPLWRGIVLATLPLLIFILLFLLLTGGLGAKVDREVLALTQQGLRAAAVECYALEGVYPSDVSYLVEHYGVGLDEERFIIHYVYIAANLMPEITVLPANE